MCVVCYTGTKERNLGFTLATVLRNMFLALSIISKEESELISVTHPP